MCVSLMATLPAEQWPMARRILELYHMPTQAPEETDILCENCGYMLNGLPATGNCPECGTTIDISISERFRQPSLWEIIGDPRPRWLRFLVTTSQIIFHPKRFFRSSTSRGQIDSAYQFALIHWGLSALLFGVAAWIHWDSERTLHNPKLPPWTSSALLLALPLLAYFATAATIRLAARLTAWEAAYRGYRLPHAVVLRALYYHSAHILPVAFTVFVTCAAYNYLLNHLLPNRLLYTSEPAYLYTLCAEVVIAAGYLFNTYWIGMRGWMYANR